MTPKHRWNTPADWLVWFGSASGADNYDGQTGSDWWVDQIQRVAVKLQEADPEYIIDLYQDEMEATGFFDPLNTIGDIHLLTQRYGGYSQWEVKVWRDGEWTWERLTDGEILEIVNPERREEVILCMIKSLLFANAGSPSADLRQALHDIDQMCFVHDKDRVTVINLFNKLDRSWIVKKALKSNPEEALLLQWLANLRETWRES